MMTSIRGPLALALLAAASNANAELFVVRVGDGAAALTNGSTATFVDRFNNDGTTSASPTIALPTAISGGHQPLTNSGTATSEGFVAESADGQYLTLAGYGSAPGVAGIVSTTSATVPRVVGRITISSGAVDTTTALSDAFSANNIRSAVSSDGTNIWAAGANGGVRLAKLGGTTTTQINSAAPTNLRVVDIFNGQLYVSSASGTFLGVGTVGTGLPTTGSRTPALLPGFPTTGTHSNYDYWFKDASTVYVADDTNTAANGGGIQKWTFDSGLSTWSLAYTLLNNGATTTGVRGLTGQIDGGDTVLYATTAATSANKLIKVIDAGASSTAVELATAPTNTVFRGVEFVRSGGPVLDADFNNDTFVNGADLNGHWRINYPKVSGAVNGDGDADGDGDVDSNDLMEWQRLLTGPITPTTPAPEPGSLALVALAVCGLAGWRQR